MLYQIVDDVIECAQGAPPGLLLQFVRVTNQRRNIYRSNQRGIHDNRGIDTGTGDAVVLLHGFASDHRGNWVVPGVVDALVDAGHRVVAPDARGHGRSDKPHEPSAYGTDAAGNDYMVRDVQELLTHLGLTSVDLAGYSMGSLVSTRLVPVEPRVRALVLGGVGSRLGSENRPRNHAAIAEALEAEDPSSIADPTARAFRAFADLSKADRLALAAIQRAPLSMSSSLDQINVPTLVLTGDNDTLVGGPQGLAERIPGATFQIVKGDHLTAVNDPAFATALVSFFDHS